MDKLIVRSIIGSLIGISVFFVIVALAEISPIYILLGIIWGIGVTNSFSFYYSHFPKFTSILKVGVLSFLTFQSSILVPLLFVMYILFYLIVGWIYGWYRVISDVISHP